jgi:predicted MPP superfamily phosphohydrolase
VADIHIASFTSEKWLNSLVDKVNAQNPDILVLTGDIIDSDLQPYLDKNVKDIFMRFKTKYGVYACMGNHEYYGGDWVEAVEAFKASGINVLIDELVQLDEAGLTIAGRDDYSSHRFKGRRRADISGILASATADYPVMVLDHQPRELNKTAAGGASLQFSGHTHNGQVFPVNFIVKKMYGTAWGLWKEGDFSLIITCGVGAWGPPIRTNSRSEIVVTDIKKLTPL